MPNYEFKLTLHNIARGDALSIIDELTERFVDEADDSVTCALLQDGGRFVLDPEDEE